MIINLQLQRFRFGDEEIELYFNPENCFTPNQVTEEINKVVRVQPNDHVYEIGAGVGPLSVLLGKRLLNGGKVYSVEIVEEQCEIARENIKMHGLEDKVEVFHGNLFEPLNGNVNIIISDVSGMNDVGAELGWYPRNVPRGGDDGCDYIIPFLEQAGRYLDAGDPLARVYFPVVVNFSDRNQILRKANEHFGSLWRLSSRRIPLKREQLEVIDNSEYPVFEPIERKGSRGFWTVEVYEARRS